MNPGAVLRRYPGSPQIALQLLRQQDRLRLIEMHTTESALLQRYAAAAGARVLAQAGDGFTALQTFLPPPSRRALILIDPSYEDKQDYRRVIVLRNQEDRPFEEIAVMMNRSENAVRKLWFRAIELLQQEMDAT